MQTRFPPPGSKELSAISFISPENTGLSTWAKPCVPEEKQDQSPSPLRVVIRPTAGSSHYAIRASMQTWAVAPQALLLLLLTSPPTTSPPPRHLYIVKKAKQPCSQQSDGCESVCCETLWCNTSSPPPTPYPARLIVHFRIPLLRLFSAKGQMEGKTSARGFGVQVKFTPAFLYLTGNYTELWHNGDQLNAAAISAGATDPKPVVQRAGGSSHLCFPLFPDCTFPPIAGPVLAKISCLTTEKAALNWGPDYHTQPQE